MNLASSQNEGSPLLFADFNQDYTSVVVGTKDGYKLYCYDPVNNKLDEIFSIRGEEICIIERLFSSSLVAIVNLNAPRKLRVCHFKKGSEICNYSYSNSILSVKLNRTRLVVCLEDSIYIHSIKDMKVIHTVRDTPPNPEGLIALSVSDGCSYLAYPGSSQMGEVQIFDSISMRAVTVIAAHDNPLASMAFNTPGTRLATASRRGTVIRVFSIPDGQKLAEFRRGMIRSANVRCLSFSCDTSFLALSSDTETVHMFRLTDGMPPAVLEGALASPPSPSSAGGACSAGSGAPAGVAAGGSAGWMDWVSGAIRHVPYMLPGQFGEMLHQDRAFALAKLPKSGLRNICAIATSSTANRVFRLLVVCEDGNMYVYTLDPVEGGECRLVKTFPLVEGGGGPEEGASLTGALGGCEGDLAVAPGSPAGPAGKPSYADQVRRARAASGSVQTAAASDKTAAAPDSTTDYEGGGGIAAAGFDLSNEMNTNLNFYDDAEYPQLSMPRRSPQQFG